MALEISRLLFICLFSLATKSLSAQQIISVTTLSEEGPPMIFLPHIGCSAEMWKDIAEHYRRTHACYLVDFAGFAGMDPVEEPYSEKFVAGLIHFIQENNFKNCILVGQNYGGYIAVKTAQEIPELVQGLVLSDFYPKLSMVLDKNISQEKLDTITSSLKTFNLTTDSAQFAAYQKQMAERMNFMNTDMVPAFINWQLESDRATLAGTAIEQINDNLIPFFEQIKIPALVFTTWYFAKTYKNMPVAEAQKTLDEMYPGAKKVTHAITEESKDFIAIDQPEWFKEQLDQFLETITPANRK